MTEREKAERAKRQSHELPESSSPSSQSITHPTSSYDRADAGGRAFQDAPFSDASQQQTDDNESARGDTPNGTRSASSRASAVSSVFSNSTRHAAAPAAQPSANVTTPLTSQDSPLHPAAISASKTQPTPTNPNPHDATSGATSQAPDTAPHPSTQDTWAPPDRIPARDPTRQVKGLRCIYDPLRDRSLDKHAKRDAKPKFQEFGSVRHAYMIQYHPP